MQAPDEGVVQQGANRTTTRRGPSYSADNAPGLRGIQLSPNSDVNRNETVAIFVRERSGAVTVSALPPKRTSYGRFHRVRGVCSSVSAVSRSRSSRSCSDVG